MKTDNLMQKLFLLLTAAFIAAACSPKNLVSLADVSKALENAQPGDTVYVKNYNGKYSTRIMRWGEEKEFKEWLLQSLRLNLI